MMTSLPTPACAVAVSVEDAGDLFAALRKVPDHRPGGARRHPTAHVLAVLVASFACAAFESFTASAQWAASADRELLLGLGDGDVSVDRRVVAPSEATIRRVASAVDDQALEAVIATWTAGQLSPVQPDAARVAVAVDSKTVRGARLAGDGPAPHLLSAATMTGRWDWHNASGPSVNWRRRGRRA